MDEFYSENLAQEVTRGMREAASRGFWVTTYAPYGYKKVYVQDGAEEEPPSWSLNPPADAVTRRIFDMALQGSSILDVDQGPQRRGRGQLPRESSGSRPPSTTCCTNEAYVGTVVWGANAKDGAPPVRRRGH